jgi:hypothetical protein
MTDSTVFDFSKLLQDAKAGAAWPEGDYDFEVVEADFVQASTGAPMIKTKLRCIVGSYANKNVMNNFVLTVGNPGALAMFFKHMAAFGLTEDWFKSIGSGDLTPVAAALRGRRARITLGHREWPKNSGVMQNDVKAVNPITGAVAAGGGGTPTGATAPPPPPTAAPTLSVVPPPPVQPSAAAVPPPPPTPLGPEPTQQQSTMAMPPPPPPQPDQPPAPQFIQAPPSPPDQYTPPANTNGAPPPPPGYTAEIWAMLPDAAKQAILSQSVSQPI